MYYLFLIAHPDDESMFFLPTILTLLHRHPSSIHHHHHPKPIDTFHILCLSNGNYDGLGTQREREIHNAVRIISHPDGEEEEEEEEEEAEGHTIGVTVLNDPKLQDGPWKWDVEYIAQEVLPKFLVEEVMVREGRSNGDRGGGNEAEDGVVVFTFDEGGVSGHTNHVDTYFGALRFCRSLRDWRRKRKEEGGTVATNTVRIGGTEPVDYLRTFSETQISLELRTLHTISNPLVKYGLTLPLLLLYALGCLWYKICDSCLPSFLVSSMTQTMDDENNGGTVPTVRTDAAASVSYHRVWEPTTVWNAMAAHQTQFVWYRRLSVLFSRYTYENTLHHVEWVDGLDAGEGVRCVGDRTRAKGSCVDVDGEIMGDEDGNDSKKIR